MGAKPLMKFCSEDLAELKQSFLQAECSEYLPVQL